MNRRILPAGLVACALILPFVLSGCGGILTSEQPAKRYYLLQPDASPGADHAATLQPDLALHVTAIPGLDTDRVLALATDARLNHYANARWPDHLPEVLTSVLQRSLGASGRFGAVSASERASGDAWLLQVEARAFYGVQDAGGATRSVRVAFGGEVSCGGARHPLSVESSRPVAEESLSVVVAAHQAGLDAATRELIARIGSLCGTW